MPDSPNDHRRITRKSAAGLFQAVLCMAAAPALLPAALPAALLCSTASAQTAAPAPRYAVVGADDVYFRSGPADTYYPMGRLQRGDVIVVLDERFGWTRVQMQGPAFREFFGHIRSPRGEGARFERLSATRGRTIGRVDLLAPNLNTSFRPADSWKRLRLLENATELAILDVTATEGDDFFHVAVPPDTEGWISSAFITSTTRAEFDAFVTRHTAAAAPEVAPERPAAPPLARETGRLDPAGTPGRAAETEARPDGTAQTPAQPQTDLPAARDAETVPPSPLTPPAPRTETAPAREEAGSATTTPPPTDTDSAAAAAPASDSAPAATTEVPAEDAPRTAMQELEALEVAFKQIQAMPIEDAEVIPLRDLFESLARTHSDHAAVSEFAKRRVEQLTLWNRLQERRHRLAALERRMDLQAGDVQAARTVVETTGTYGAVGRLVASTIFEGERLPRLFRLQDPTSGRTLAYIRPDDAFDLNSMLGQVIGISGDRTFDPGLRIDLIRPRRIDLLVPGR